MKGYPSDSARITTSTPSSREAAPRRTFANAANPAHTLGLLDACPRSSISSRPARELPPDFWAPLIGPRPAAHLAVRRVGHMTEQGNYKICRLRAAVRAASAHRCTRGDRAGGPSLVQP